MRLLISAILLRSMDEEEEFLENHKVVSLDGIPDVAYFRFTPTGLSTRWYSELSRWVNPVRGLHSDQDIPDLPTDNQTVLDALHWRVCVFNGRLLAGFRAKPSERKLVRHAYSSAVAPNASVVWSHGILTAVVLDRLLWADNAGPRARPPQVPYRVRAELKTDAQRMRTLYDTWPSTVGSFVRQWQEARDASRSHGSYADQDGVVASLVQGIKETSARARTSVVENNFCYAALGVLCLTMVSHAPSYMAVTLMFALDG